MVWRRGIEENGNVCRKPLPSMGQGVWPLSRELYSHKGNLDLDFMHIPFSFRKKSKKTVNSDQQEPSKRGSTRGGVKADCPHHFHAIKLSYQFFFHSLIEANFPGLHWQFAFSPP